ncbi:uncharacterized protein CMC5_051310 [Chondromyces crocatus]|uniref:Uncharacterized protein n=1 Tax=Chondromyces crocatus TaxID=52 RepID=A0A0K1EJD3_CHOCO|nr:uncharacterized protein CMC5_051310 [Chondromyces crocatus]
MVRVHEVPEETSNAAEAHGIAEEPRWLTPGRERLPARSGGSPRRNAQPAVSFFAMLATWRPW